MVKRVSGTRFAMSKITEASESALDRKLFNAKGSIDFIGTRPTKVRGMRQFKINPPDTSSKTTPKKPF